MANKDQEEMRFLYRLSRAQGRQDRVEFLRRDFRFIAREAKPGSDHLPASQWVARESALPADFSKVMDGLGMCTPKSLRIARRTVELWYRLDSKVFISVFNRSFFDDGGQLKPAGIDRLISEFHDSLLCEIRRMKDEGRHVVPLYKALMKNGSGAPPQ